MLTRSDEASRWYAMEQRVVFCEKEQNRTAVLTLIEWVIEWMICREKVVVKMVWGHYMGSCLTACPLLAGTASPKPATTSALSPRFLRRRTALPWL